MEAVLNKRYAKQQKIKDYYKREHGIVCDCEGNYPLIEGGREFHSMICDVTQAYEDGWIE